jgi:hypothetical protein
MTWVFSECGQRQEQRQRQEQPQIPPLRYGMTNKRAGNNKSNSNSNGDGNGKNDNSSENGWGGAISFRWCLE